MKATKQIAAVLLQGDSKKNHRIALALGVGAAVAALSITAVAMLIKRK